MELTFDRFAERAVVASQQRSLCSENSLDESQERRDPPAHRIASYIFPLDHIPHGNC
jgi:hypothetical protein